MKEALPAVLMDLDDTNHRNGKESVSPCDRKLKSLPPPHFRQGFFSGITSLPLFGFWSVKPYNHYNRVATTESENPSNYEL